MGSWGAGIFQDDSTLDLKTEYQALLAFGTPEEESYQLVKGRFYNDFCQCGFESDFWYAMAVIQHKYGILRTCIQNN